MIDTGDTSFIMICMALVFLKTPGLALFYGGMVRKKNVLSTTNAYFYYHCPGICLMGISWLQLVFRDRLERLNRKFGLDRSFRSWHGT